ncbi:hypothetical protein [Sphingobacterium detergens]|uniref:Uncharacterized protein n=1 Tax=Sphingobacterium detergens TaxID=1145106 RepID=A0A420B6K5_SPHD1|nr:hypothetical protein [Sphingobacterium detergens]RKE52303.1 hypothetical protein DFQ12_2537 [Sphingobacterium detergens]
MNSLLKKLNLGAIAALVGIVGLTVSWKNHESKLAPVWLEVNDTGTPGTPSNQQIVGNYPGGTPGGECDQTTDRMCAVQIDFKSYTGPRPTNLAQANALEASGQIEIVESLYKTNP